MCECETNVARNKIQISACVSLGVVTIISTFSLSYIFVARDIEYRCFIPECENISDTTYNPEWLEKFVPFEEKSPSSCLRYALVNNTCSNKNILENKVTKCDTFVYQRKEETIVQDFGIFCEENLWKLTLIGTLSVVGEVVCLTYAGFISDRFGREKLMMISLFMGSIVGVIRSLSTDFVMYAILEFLDTALSAGMYGAAFILAMELVDAERRDIANVIVNCIYTSGQAILGITAWLSPSWRVMLRVLYGPGIVFVSLLWVSPESRTWLLATRKKEQAEEIASEMKVMPNEAESIVNETEKVAVERKRTGGFLNVVQEKVLLMRIIHCSFTWLSSNFVYYGLTLHSVALSENMYLDFVFGVAIEMPGYVLYYYGNQRFRRRLTMLVAFVSTGVCCLGVAFIKKEFYWMKLTIFLIGKCCSTVVFTLIYVFTTELFPTTSRHATFSICSLFGRIGSMMAPQVPLLARISSSLPMMTFGIISVIAGILALFFPETLNTKLPETIEDAIDIGKSSAGDRNVKE